MIRRLIDWWRGPQPVVIPEALWQATLADLSFLARLDTGETARLRQLAGKFLARKQFSAAGGLSLTDAMCVNIAAQGCLPVLELGLEAYGSWVEVIIYPDEFIVERRIEDENGVVHEFADILSGEAWPGGPLIISWQDAHMAGEGYSVVIHEFVHKLDMQSGEADGMPPLHSGLRRMEWESILFAAYEHFCRQVDSGRETLLDPYASEHPAEFFAVFSEAFFVTPALVYDEFRAFYDLLVRYFRQDPLRRGKPNLE